MNLNNNKYYSLILLTIISPIVFAKHHFKDISYDIKIVKVKTSEYIKKDKKVSKHIEEISEIRKNIVEKLSTYKKDLLNNQSPKMYTYYYNNLRSIIETAIYPYGYFNPKIAIRHSNKNKLQTTKINIELGEPIITKSIAITFTGSGADEKSLKKTLKRVPLKEGKIFRSIDYEDTKRLLNSWASNNGYIRAEFVKHSADINTIDRTAIVILHFDIKQKFYFGDITIGETNIDKDLIRKYLDFKKNDVFTSKKLVDSYSNLAGSDLFEFVNLQPDFSDLSNIVPINITLGPRKKIGLGASVGYSSNVGFDSYLDIAHRRVNSKGHTAKVHMGYSEFLKNIGFVYSLPVAKPITDSYSITTNFKKIDINVGKSNSASIGASWSRTNVRWNKTISLNYSYESYTIFSTEEKSQTHLVVPEFVIFRKKTNDNVFPTYGYKIYWNINGAHRNALSSNTYLQSTIKLDFIFTIKDLRFVQRNKFGGNFLIDKITELPPSRYFLEGGNSSLRGYNFQSEIIGTGKYVYLSSLDMQIPVIWRWYLTAFYDIGNVFDKFNTPLRSSIGGGIMFKTPIGPVNFGIAKALEKDAPKFRIFFSIGSEI